MGAGEATRVGPSAHLRMYTSLQDWTSSRLKYSTRDPAEEGRAVPWDAVRWRDNNKAPISRLWQAGLWAVFLAVCHAPALQPPPAPSRPPIHPPVGMSRSFSPSTTRWMRSARAGPSSGLPCTTCGASGGGAQGASSWQRPAWAEGSALWRQPVPDQLSPSHRCQTNEHPY